LRQVKRARGPLERDDRPPVLVPLFRQGRLAQELLVLSAMPRRSFAVGRVAVFGQGLDAHVRHAVLAVHVTAGESFRKSRFQFLVLRLEPFLVQVALNASKCNGNRSRRGP